MLLTYLALIGVVFGFNLMPAFAPPTWSVLVLFSLNSDLPAVPLVLVGAMAAASGRMCLAYATGLLRHKVSAEQRANLEAAGEVLNRRTSHHIVGLLLFAISPLPSAQLFEAAGLIGMRIVPLTLAFFSGRIVSYSIYVAGTTTLKAQGLSDVIKESLTSPWGIAFQLAMLVGVYLLTKINWVNVLGKKSNSAD